MGVDNEGFAAPGSFPPTNPVPPPPAVNPASPGWSADQPYGAPPPPPGPFDAPGASGAPGTPAASSTSGTSSAPSGPFHPMPPLPGYGGALPISDSAGSASEPKKRRAGVPVILCVLIALVAGAVGGVAGVLIAPGGQTETVTLPPPTPADKGEPVTGSVTAVADAVLPSVVSIDAGMSSGSGFVVRTDGYLLTNHHVIANVQGELSVTFSDGRKESAEVIGSTGSYDLAVIKVDRDDLIPLELADSDAVEVGDQVVAIGAPLGLEGTVTTGIVSALNRPVAAGDEIDTAFINAIQTDTAINPGNSGGPLVNMAGQVVGIASAIAQVPGSSGSIGLGFAIPANQVRRTADQIIDTGTATYPIVGVLLDNLYNGENVQVLDDPSADVEAVTSGGPADLAGIKPGDVILAIDARPVTHPNELIVAIRAKAPGDEVTLTIRPADGSGEKELELILDETESE